MDLEAYLRSRHLALAARVQALTDLIEVIPPARERTPNDLLVKNVLHAMREADTAESNEIVRQIRVLKQ